MKQQGIQQAGREGRAGQGGTIWCDLADFEAWQGYEFWSAQLEASIENLDDFETGARELAQPEQRGQTDALPF